jgi:hypothetical protein
MTADPTSPLSAFVVLFLLVLFLLFFWLVTRRPRE